MQPALAEPEIATRTGQPVAVTMPLQDGEALAERGEDTEDMTWLTGAAPSLKPATRNMELRAAVGLIPNDQAQLADLEVQEELTKRVIAYEIAAHAAEQGVSEEAARKRGMEAKSKEFVEKGAEVYTKA